MQSKHVVLEINTVLTMEDFLERKLLFLVDRKKGTMHMRVLLVTVDDERYDVFFTIFVGNETIDVCCPLLYFWHSSDVFISLLTLEINLLVAKGQLTHTFCGASEDEIYHCSVTWFIQPLVWVFDAT